MRKPPKFSEIKSLGISEQLSIWGGLVGTTQLYKPILSPFREDSKIGGGVFLDEYKGKIVLTDFTNSKYHNVDVFSAIMMLKGMNFPQMCEYLSKGHVYHPIKESVDTKCYITPNLIEGFYKPIVDYFNTYDITIEDLRTDGHANADKLYVNRWDKKLKKRTLETFVPKYAHVLYRFPSGNVKLYQPLEENEKLRWAISNTNKNDFFRCRGNDKNLFIGSSYKDIKVGVRLFSDGANGLAFQNEGLNLKTLNNEIWDFIDKHQNIIICGDKDSAGVKYTKELKQQIPKALIWEYPETPEKNQYNKKIKDIAEVYRYDKNLI